MSAYTLQHIDPCIFYGHHLTVIGSDKTPLKRSLICETCSSSGRTVLVAYGQESGSFGAWRRPKLQEVADETSGDY
jgi:hypothetical protein